MTTCKAHIWYNADGEILAVGHVPAPVLDDSSEPSGYVARRSVAPVSHANQHVLEADLDTADLDRLHETHRVDVQKHALIQRAQQPGRS